MAFIAEMPVDMRLALAYHGFDHLGKHRDVEGYQDVGGEEQLFVLLDSRYYPVNILNEMLSIEVG